MGRKQSKAQFVPDLFSEIPLARFETTENMRNHTVHPLKKLYLGRQRNTNKKKQRKVLQLELFFLGGRNDNLQWNIFVMSRVIHSFDVNKTELVWTI